ncbi:MAG: branched-chain amino acid ABC transporter permease [Syntrophobacteraceae bacterium]
MAEIRAKPTWLHARALRSILISIVFASLLALPALIGKSWLNITIEILIMALAACSLNLMLGYTGLVSFGPAGLYAVGAYTTAILLTRFKMNIVPAMIAAPIMAAIVGWAVGWVCVRRTKVYFALLTLAFSQIIWTIIFEWYAVTGGDNGIISIPTPEFFFSIVNSYYFCLAVVGCCIFALWRIVNSPFGRTLQAIRENPGRVEFIGVNLKRYQLAAFILSSIFLGIAGSLYCVFSDSAFPDFAHWTKSTDMLVVCLLGGIYRFSGPLVGSAIYTILAKTLSKHTMHWNLILGVAIVLLVLLMRNGVMGFLSERLSRKNQARPLA